MLQPITIRTASAFVDATHRHHAASRGGRFALGALMGGKLVGVLLAGRPVARMLDDGWTLELTRCCTDGTRNACSFLYGAAVRVAVAMGYRRVVTYTLSSESGASLKAAGFVLDGVIPGLSWSRASRPRTLEPLGEKRRWVRLAKLDERREQPS